MALSDTAADQIASLLNKRNELTVQYTRARVLEHEDNYIFRHSDDGTVIACVEVKKVQWYQTEILHLTVHSAHEGRGHAKALLREAERKARGDGARILQCTIRSGNDASRWLFEGFGFSHVCTFLNQGSGNNVGVFQKVLSSAR